MAIPEYPKMSESYEVPPPPHSPAKSHLAAVLVLLIGMLLLLVLPYLAKEISYSITFGQEKAKYEAAKIELAGLSDDASRYRMAAKVIEPSVVGIDTVRVVGTPAVDDEYSMFPHERQFEAAGQGSGVIIDSAGYILTNSHVVAQTSSVDVKLSDGRMIRGAEVIGADPVSDLAVLKISSPGLIAAKWGSSDELEVGDQVLAVGNPYGLARSVTAGIVSARDRRVDIENVGPRDFLQTDAAVNPGNSGGPLVNMRGEVVGINTAIVGNSYRGISFAIPSALAQRVFERLKTSGIARGWLGVQMQDVTEDLARQLGLKEARGVVVTRVVPDSPASQAGIQEGDVIVAVNYQPVRDSEDLRLAVARAKIGAEATIDFYRDGQPMKLPATIQKRPGRLQVVR